MYKSNRYSVPYGSFDPKGRKVILEIKEDNIWIVDSKTGAVLSKHKMSISKGKLIKNRADRKDKDQKVRDLKEKAISAFSNNNQATQFISEVTNRYPSYLRDQYQLIVDWEKEHSKQELDWALKFCLKNKLFSANDFKMVIKEQPQYKQHLKAVKAQTTQTIKIPVFKETALKLKDLNPEIRSLEVYIKILKGETNGTD